MKLHPLEIDFSRHISLQKKHPWIFRDKFKSYTKTFKNGDIIHIKDIQSNRETYGIYSESGPVSIRIFHFSNTFNLDTLLINSIRKRFPLLKETNSLRWIHGENDGFPGVVIDGHANVLTVMYYSPSLQVYARFLASKVFKILSSSSEVIDKPEIIINLQARRTGEGKTSGTRFWRGNIDKNAEIMIHYDKLNYRIRPFSGKGGIYNDIRNLRRYLSLHIELIKNKHILNLFSNNGLLSIYLEKLGASQVTSLESSNTMLENHRNNLIISSNKQIISKVDIFQNLKTSLSALNQKYHMIIIDPPNLTASEKDKEKAKKTYKRLITETLPFLKRDGILIMCSCSNRIKEEDFMANSISTFKEYHLKYKLLDKLKEEIDHPCNPLFPEGKYFKVHIFRIY